MLFGRSPRGLFPPFFFFFFKIPLPLSYPRGDRFPQKNYIPRGATSEDITVVLPGSMHWYFVLYQVYRLDFNTYITITTLLVCASPGSSMNLSGTRSVGDYKQS